LYEYGRVGGADVTVDYYPPNRSGEVFGKTIFETVLDDLSGTWYSHYAGIGRLDGYRIGKWKDFETIMGAKLSPFPDTPWETYTDESGSFVPDPEDYFVFYDGSVYGQADDNSAPRQDWEGNFGFCGIVRGINLFYDNPGRGSIIIEYLKGCYPEWLTKRQGLKDGEKPFFGIYYRVLGPDLVQMANAVNLAALYNGDKYYTETGTLREAMDSKTVEYEAEYISWGVVIPQDREPEK
jgi:hypothetical protein